MDPMTTSALISGGIGVGQGVLGMITQKKREERAMQNTQKLMGVQFQNQKALDKYGQQLQLETWEKTNYPAQVEMLKEAGLNPGLLYAKGGAGGVTGSQGGGSASSGSAPAPQPPPMEIGNALMMASQIALNKAQAKKVEAEANVIGSTGVKEAETRIAKMIQETTNEATKQRLIELEGDIAEIETANRQYRLEAEISNILERTNQLRIQNQLTAEQFDAIVAETKLKAVGQALINSLTEVKTRGEEAGIKLTEAQRQNIFTSLQQKWTELGLDQRKLDQDAQRILIETFKAEIDAEYPGIGEVGGSILKKAYNYIENLENLVNGKGYQNPEDKVNK